ncbi:MAG: hypothetical protein JWM80_758 [Cyanobacteria bacterium RYN_339]|nr:hypothetical protein [Cyanobacteria bacterium RYN_339]
MRQNFRLLIGTATASLAITFPLSALANSYAQAYYDSFASGTTVISVQGRISDGYESWPSWQKPDDFYVSGYDSSGALVSRAVVEEVKSGVSLSRSYWGYMNTYDTGTATNSTHWCTISATPVGNYSVITYMVRVEPDASFATGYRVDASFTDANGFHSTNYYNLGSNSGHYFGRGNANDDYGDCNYNYLYQHDYSNAWNFTSGSWVRWQGCNLRAQGDQAYGCGNTASATGTLYNGGTVNLTVTP